MALNPFFLQGSPSEQRLVQDIINEQLKIYGVEVIYIPRKFVRKETIIEEISSSVFDENFAIEAYVNNYEGYSGSGDILTKFGVSLKDELSLVISKERFEEFISPFLDAMDDSEIELSTRPREGDVIYFPLGQRLFEVNFVEHEQPFYQLGKTYVYELRCELFEYEDEVLNTTIEEVDEIIQNEGYITTLKLISNRDSAVSLASTSTGYIKKIYLNNDGYGYAFNPTVSITPAPTGGTNASAIAVTQKVGGVRSVKEILFINCGSGYTVAPKITITGGGGIGAAATCEIETLNYGVTNINIIDPGNGYTSPVNVSIDPPGLFGDTCEARATINSIDGSISNVYIVEPGFGYIEEPLISIASTTSNTGIGTFKFNEIVTGSISGTTARVKDWDKNTNILKVSINNGQFYEGETLVGSDSNSTYIISSYDVDNIYDKYAQNKQLETEADSIIDFSQSNPFGNY